MFKRRSGLGGLRIVVGPMRRDDPATGGAGGADPAAGGGGTPAATPPAPPAPAPSPAPAPVDVTQTKEYKEALAKATADIEAKARAGTKANAQKEIFETLAAALGQKSAEVDPAAIGAELATAREENKRLQLQIAIGSAARAAGGDEDMVTAWLSHKGKLRDLDPSAADFATKVETLVKGEIQANPKLKAETTGVTPPAAPGTSGAVAGGMAGGAREGSRVLGLGNALAAAQQQR